MLEKPKEIDTGLQALAVLLRFHGIAVDTNQIEHQFAGAPIRIPEMLRCAKTLKLRARAINADWASLQKAQLPAIMETRDGEFLIVAKVADAEVLVHVPSIGRPQLTTRAQFEAQWTGRLLLMTKRASLGDLARRFDVSWFLQAMHKYRRMFTEVLVASFFLQLLALVTPLFFQVVTDKVLVHRGYSTLDVLAVGVVAISVFEVVLGGRTTRNQKPHDPWPVGDCYVLKVRSIGLAVLRCYKMGVAYRRPGTHHPVMR